MGDKQDRLALFLKLPLRLQVAILACEAECRRSAYMLPKGHRELKAARRDLRKAVVASYEFAQGRRPSELVRRSGVASLKSTYAAQLATACIARRKEYPGRPLQWTNIDQFNFGDLYASDGPSDEQLHAASEAASVASAAAQIATYVGLHELDPRVVNGDSYLGRIQKTIDDIWGAVDLVHVDWTKVRRNFAGETDRFLQLGVIIDPDLLKLKAG